MASPNTATASAAAGPLQIQMPGLGNQPDAALNVAIVSPAPVAAAAANVVADMGTPRPSDADLAPKVRVVPIRLTEWSPQSCCNNVACNNVAPRRCRERYSTDDDPNPRPPRPTTTLTCLRCRRCRR